MYIVCDKNNKILVNHPIDNIEATKRAIDDYQKMFPTCEVIIYELKEVY